MENWNITAEEFYRVEEEMAAAREEFYAGMTEDDWKEMEAVHNDEVQ